MPRWGRADLALEVYIRTSDLIGREIQLEESIGVGIYVASNQGIGFDERELNIFAEAIGRIYHEYNKGDRGQGAPSCPTVFADQQQQYLTRIELGLLCTLGTLSEWYGENDSAEYHSLFIVDSIRLGILDLETEPNGGISWRERGSWINDPAARVLGRPTEEDCRNWETGLNRAGSDNSNPSLNILGCPWVWGNQSKLYENAWAMARLENIQNSSVGISASNNRIVEGDPGPSYLVSTGTPYNYSANSDSNVEFRAISLILEQQNPFYMFTIIQNNILKCNSPLQAVSDPNSPAGYYPACPG